MDEHDAFVRAIREQPRDPFPRLVYADYLDEQGDPRGEFIRIQCALSDLPAADQSRPELREREQMLLADYEESWLASLRELGLTGVSSRCFRGGLIERARIDTRVFVKNADRLCDLEPALQTFELKQPQAAIEDLAGMRFPMQIRELDLSANGLTAGDLRPFRFASWTAQIRSLDLQFNQLDDDGVANLVDCDWSGLDTLRLGMNDIQSAGGQSLAKASMNLRELDLGVNFLGDGGVASLVGSTFAASLTTLNLSSNQINADGGRALLNTQHLAALERLNLRGNRIPREVVAELETRFLGLRELDLRNSATEPRW